MTTKELIEQLEKYPSETEVYLAVDMGLEELREDGIDYSYDVLRGKKILGLY